jgi:hypothetical protein
VKPSTRGGVYVGVASVAVFVGFMVLFDHWDDNRAGTAVAAERRGETLALPDHVPWEDGMTVRTTLVDLRTGAKLERQERELGPSIGSPPEQRCAGAMRRPGNPTLVSRLDYEMPGGVRVGEAPAGEIVIGGPAGALVFLAQPGTRDAITLADDHVLLLHMFSFDATAPRGMPEKWISRLDAQGLPVWSYRLAGECQLAFVHAETVVIATADGARRAIALDLATGAPRWRFAH